MREFLDKNNELDLESNPIITGEVEANRKEFNINDFIRLFFAFNLGGYIYPENQSYLFYKLIKAVMIHYIFI